MSMIFSLLHEIEIPKFYRIQNHLCATHLTDVPAAVRSALTRPGTLDRVFPGATVCFTGSSREIANAVPILRTLAEEFRRVGANPVLVPAMGSHGGALAENQRAILTHYGITEASIGCPIHSSMDTVEVGKTPEGLSVHMDAFAVSCDLIVPVGRIKAHTQFHGSVESGIMKMITIGLGKQHGADLCHAFGMRALARYVPEFARVSLKNCNIPFGIGILENGVHDTYQIAAIPSEHIEEEEPELLKLAKSLMPSFPYDEIDIVMVDQMGKEISGDGMDTNVIGRDFFARGKRPGIQRIAVRDLSKKTGSNFYGIALADMVTCRLFDKISFEETYPNFITNVTPEGVTIPAVLASDKLCLQACIKTCIRKGPDFPRVAWIRDTLHLGEFYVSESLRRAPIAEGYTCTFEDTPLHAEFDPDGNFLGFQHKSA